VTSQAASTEVRVASAATKWFAETVADAGTASVPIPTYAGSPDAAVQPLSMGPQPGNVPDPRLSGGTYSVGPTSGDVGGDNGPTQLSGNDAGTSGGLIPEEDDDSQSSCDPPDNMFGVDKGQLIATNATGMLLGRGSGDGIVCLLLRPFIDLARLGWPERGSAEVDYGTVSLGFAGGHEQPDHIVFRVRYRYGTTPGVSSVAGSRHITAVIDYGDVTGFCPELSHALAARDNPAIADWLAGDDLEQRLCISAMKGQTMHVTASAVDGDAGGPSSTGRSVDPQNLLYEDAWGHF
jgi:hypothetical protein